MERVVRLVPLEPDDRNQFVLDNQEAFRCGFKIVEFYNSHHPDPNDPEAAEHIDEQFPAGMFRFEKRI